MALMGRPIELYSGIPLWVAFMELVWLIVHIDAGLGIKRDWSANLTVSVISSKVKSSTYDSSFFSGTVVPGKLDGTLLAPEWHISSATWHLACTWQVTLRCLMSDALAG